MKVLQDFIESTDGVTENEIYKKFPRLNRSTINSTLKSLIQRKLIIFKDNKYMKIDKENTIEEEKLFKIIENCGNKGIGLRELNKSGIPKNLITKLLRNLEIKNKIKSFKTYKNKQKVYIISNLTPEINNSLFIEDNVDIEFVNEVLNIVEKIIQKNSKDKYSENIKFDEIKRILNADLLSVKLKDDEIKSILDVLIADNKIIELKYSDKIMYKIYGSD